MIRNHVIATIKVRFRISMERPDSENYSRETRYHNPSEHRWIGLFPSEEHARTWVENNLRHRKDGEIISIKSVQPDACIIAYDY